MAEIKSTFDLVMEKTRHLRLSDEEKRELALNDFKAGLGGLLQKFKEGLLKVGQFKDELQRLGEKSKLQDDSIFVYEACKRLELDQDNQWLLALLRNVCAANTKGIEAVLMEYKTTLKLKVHVAVERIKGDLSGKGISGSAVVPNLEADRDWMEERQKIHVDFTQLLEQEIGKLSCLESND